MIRTLLHPVTWLLGSLCILWVSLAEVGGFTLQLPYVTLAVVALFAATGPGKIRATIAYARSNLLWIAPLALYLAILTGVLHGSQGQNIAPRQIFYLLTGLAVAGCLASTRQPARILRTGAALGLLSFLVAIEILGRKIGVTWLDAISEFMTSGDLDFVTYSFFRAIFNSLDAGVDGMISSSRKNDIAAGVLVLGLTFRAGSNNARRDFIGMGVIAVAIGLLLLINTRSVLIAAGGSFLVAIIVGTAIHPAKNNFLLMMKLVGALTLMAFAAYSGLSDTAVSGTIGERFSFGDDSAAARVDQISTAFERIEQNPLRGSGYFEVEGQPIHNLFLGAWMHAGLLAVVLVILFYTALLARWIVYSLRISRMPELWVSPIAFEWLAALPLMPLFRVWLSGDAGHPYLSEWVAISIFFGCCLGNERARRRLSRLTDASPADSVFLPRGAPHLAHRPVTLR